MQLEHIKTTVAVLWVIATGAAGLFVNVTSSTSWLVLAGCAILPPVAMMHYWQHPAATMSENIRQVLR